jgi:hypothetical protein
MTNDFGILGSFELSTLRTCVRFLTRFLTILSANVPEKLEKFAAAKVWSLWLALMIGAVQGG